MRDWKKIALLLVLVALLVGINVFRPSSETVVGPALGSGSRGRAANSNPSSRIPDAELEVERLLPSNRVRADEIRRNIFQYGRAPVPPRRVVRPQVETAAPPAPPPPEPRPPLQFFGFAEGGAGGGQRALLTDGEEIFVVTEGDIVLEHYRVTRVQRESIEIEDMRRNRRWVLPLEQP